MRKDGRTHSPDEPARQSGYRKLYLRYKHDMDRVEDEIDFLKRRLEALAERIEKLEFKDHQDW